MVLLAGHEQGPDDGASAPDTAARGGTGAAAAAAVAEGAPAHLEWAGLGSASHGGEQRADEAVQGLVEALQPSPVVSHSHRPNSPHLVTQARSPRFAAVGVRPAAEGAAPPPDAGDHASSWLSPRKGGHAAVALSPRPPAPIVNTRWERSPPRSRGSSPRRSPHGAGFVEQLAATQASACGPRDSQLIQRAAHLQRRLVRRAAARGFGLAAGIPTPRALRTPTSPQDSECALG